MEELDLQKMSDLNPNGVSVGEIVTAANRGIHRIEDLRLEDGDIIAEYRQLYTIDGKPVNLGRTDLCPARLCRSAVMEIAEFKRRANWLIDLVEFLESQKL